MSVIRASQFALALVYYVFVYVLLVMIFVVDTKQLIAWKDSSVKWPVMYRLDVKLYSVAHFHHVCKC